MFHIFFLIIALEGVLSLCPNKCSGHGLCSKSQTCKCYDGWTGVDCSHRKCPYGPSWGINSDSSIECSGRGKCDEEKGICKCDEGFTGKSCQVTECPSTNEKGVCNGHGNCMSISTLHYHYVKPDGSDLEGNNVEFKNRYFGCMCSNGWYGYDCSQKNCPVGAVDGKGQYDTVSFFKYGENDIKNKFPYKITIVNCGEESDTLILNNDYCRKVTVEITANSVSNQYLRELIISKGIVNDIVIRFLEDSCDEAKDISSSAVWEFNFVTDPYARVSKIVYDGNSLEDKAVISPNTPANLKDVGNRKQPKPDCLTSSSLCHYQSVKVYKLCSGNGDCDLSTGRCSCETVSPNKYILDNYGFGFDYVKNWNCQIKNSDDTPYKTDKYCNGEVVYFGQANSEEHHPYCKCDNSRKGHKCEIPTCDTNIANSWFSPVQRSSVCSDMGKCDINKGCVCRNGYESKDCSQMSCPNNCEPNGKCQIVHPGSKPVLSECICNKGYQGYDCLDVSCPYGVDIYDCDIDTEEPPYLQMTCDGWASSVNNVLKYNNKEITIEQSSTTYNSLINDLNSKFELKGEISPFSCSSTTCTEITSLDEKICNGISTADNNIHLRFYYYCNEDLYNYLQVNGEKISFVKGSRKCFECSNHGSCNRNDGSCNCVSPFGSSNNRDKNGVVKVGQKGDCSYFIPYSYPQKKM